MQYLHGYQYIFVFYVYKINGEYVNELCYFSNKDFLWFKCINNKHICNCKHIILTLFFYFQNNGLALQPNTLPFSCSFMMRSYIWHKMKGAVYLIHTHVYYFLLSEQLKETNIIQILKELMLHTLDH